MLLRRHLKAICWQFKCSFGLTYLLVCAVFFLWFVEVCVSMCFADMCGQFVFEKLAILLPGFCSMAGNRYVLAPAFYMVILRRTGTVLVAKLVFCVACTNCIGAGDSFWACDLLGLAIHSSSRMLMPNELQGPATQLPGQPQVNAREAPQTLPTHHNRP